MIPTANEDNMMMIGERPNLPIKDKSDEYNALNIIAGNRTYNTRLLNWVMLSFDNKLILLRKYPKAIIMKIGKIVNAILSMY